MNEIREMFELSLMEVNDKIKEIIEILVNNTKKYKTLRINIIYIHAHTNHIR